MTTKGEEITTIGKGSRVSVALLASILTVTAAAAGGGSAWATRIEARLESIEDKLSLLDRWTESDMQAWTAEFKASNQSIVVPKAEHRFVRSD